MKHLVEKTVSCLLTLTMMISMLPTQVFATISDDPANVTADAEEELSVLAESFEINFVEDNSLETVEDAEDHTDNIDSTSSEPETNDDPMSDPQYSNTADIMSSEDLSNGVELQATNIEC